MKKRILITMNEELLEKIEKKCREMGVSKSAYLSILADEDLYFRERQAKNGK